MSSPAASRHILPPGPLHLILLRASPSIFDQSHDRFIASSRAEFNTRMKQVPPTASSSSVPLDTLHNWDVIVAEGLALEASLAEWPSRVPSTWAPVSVLSSQCIHQSIRQTAVYGTECDIYPSINTAGLWNWYRTLRISSIRVLMTCLSLQDDSSRATLWEPSVRRLAELAQTLTDEFCRSIPFHLGNRQPDSLAMDYQDICYPILPPDPVATSNQGLYTTSLPNTEHKCVTALSGTWYLLDPLKEILAITAPFPHSSTIFLSDMNSSNLRQPLLKIRPGQREWLMAQLERIESINANDRLRRKSVDIML